MKRRIFLQALGLSAIATRGYTANADAAARFTHGVASVDPLSDRVIHNTLGFNYPQRHVA